MLEFGIATLILIVTILVGFPIAYSIGLTTIFYIFITNPANLLVIPIRMFSGINSFTLMALPLFMLAAEIMVRTGISSKLFDFVRITRVGRWRGGLAYVNVLASTIFGSISGAALAFIGLVFLAIHDASDFSLGGHLAGYDGDLSMLLAVFSLSFVGFGVKAAIWPLHGWLPSAAVAPTPVTALLHAVAVVKAGAFACIRLIYYSFGPDILSGTWAQQLALLLPIITIVYGSCMSLKQRHFKLRLAYSTVSNLSYILFAAALMTTQALAASFLHLIVHSVVKIMAFFTAGAVLHYAHREYVPQLEGLARYMPVTFACFTVAACALTGIPPFNGFVSKWYIARAAVDIGGWLPLVGFAALLVSALLTAVYMFQVVLKAWFPRTEAPAIPEGSAHEAGWMMTVPTAVLAAACLVMGLFPRWLLDVIGKAVGL